MICLAASVVALNTVEAHCHPCIVVRVRSAQQLGE